MATAIPLYRCPVICLAVVSQKEKQHRLFITEVIMFIIKNVRKIKLNSDLKSLIILLTKNNPHYHF